MRLPHRTLANDVHSKLNRTRHRSILFPGSANELRRAIESSAGAVVFCGARHAMGGQQFVDGGTLIDMRRLNRVLSFDAGAGLVEAEAGIQWPSLMRFLEKAQSGQSRASAARWAIRQKQTGADDLTLGGALSANVHGRGLAMPPIVADVESFTLFDAAGQLQRCSRAENAELFRLVIGGYGLFGAIYSVVLRLTQRCKLERVVDVAAIEGFIPHVEQSASSYLYGDFQFAIDPASEDFLQRGVLALYRTLPSDTDIPTRQRQMHARDWLALLRLAFTDKSAAFDRYSAYYRSTDGQRYFSDTHQLGPYVEGYASVLRRSFGWRMARTLMISELYVPRERLTDFMTAARRDLRNRRVEVIYGTVRLSEADTETFLPWARQRSACVIFNLAVEHTASGIAAARDAFVSLIDRAIDVGGSFYLTYHRWARRDQVLTCYPCIKQFLAHKLKHDPQDRIQSDWYRHLKTLLT